MNWFTNFVRPKIQALVKSSNTPENLWEKCPSCEKMLFSKELEKQLNVCHHCNYHLRIPFHNRLKTLYDGGIFELYPVPSVRQDPLKFKDTKRYADRLKDYRTKTKRDDAIVTAFGTIGGKPCVISCLDFSFMGGSMGMAVGEGIVQACHLAIEKKAALLSITASGGARMQEGILSLMQMPRTTIAVRQLKEAGLPYLTYLTNPTTGGVSASFAMLGDVAMAEPGAIIGFAGARVIQETIRQKLPEGFQRAEYLQDHGMLDCVVERGQARERISTLLSYMMNA
jgi:acetyl-CoA carboxylase carboxyl transferase subunit beta